MRKITPTLLIILLSCITDKANVTNLSIDYEIN